MTFSSGMMPLSASWLPWSSELPAGSPLVTPRGRQGQTSQGLLWLRRPTAALLPPWLGAASRTGHRTMVARRGFRWRAWRRSCLKRSVLHFFEDGPQWQASNLEASVAVGDALYLHNKQ
jgi:hypothetical protein